MLVVLGLVAFFGEVDFEGAELLVVEGITKGGHAHLGVALNNVFGEGAFRTDMFPIAFDERATESAFKVFAVAGSTVLLIQFINFAGSIFLLSLDWGHSKESETDDIKLAHE